MPEPIAALSKPCDPPVSNVIIADEANEQINQRLRELHAADQATRAQDGQTIDWTALGEADRQRRMEVLAYLQAGKVARAAA